MRIKYICKKLIVCTLVFLTLFNFIISPVGRIDQVWAAPEGDVTEFENVAESMISARNNGIAGILSWLLRVIAMGIFGTIQIGEFLIADSAGNDGTVSSVFVTPLDIFFNRFTLTDINIFTTEGLEPGGLVYNIRVNASLWYNVFRAVAVAILLVMLLIIGIKMAMATLAEQKAKVKQLFMDWVVSLALVMFMSLIVVLIVNVNNQLVNVIKRVADGAGASELMTSLMAAAFSDNFLLGIGATITYVLMVLQTFIFVIIYIKRFLVVLFLTIISPLIPLAYSIDRAKGGQARILNNWIKEYCYNVFIQIIHCVIYVVLIAVPLSSLGTSITGLESLATSVILIFAMMFVKKAEELLKAIFGFDKATTLSTYSSTINNMQNAVMTGVSVATGTYINNTTNNNMLNKTTFGNNIQNFGEKVSTRIHEYKDKASQYINSYETKPMKDDVLSGRENKRNGRDDVIDAEWEVVDDNKEAKRNTSSKNAIPLPSDATPENADMYSKLLAAVSESQSIKNENNEHLDTENNAENNEYLVIEETSKTENDIETEEKFEGNIPNTDKDRNSAHNAGVVIAINPAMQKAVDEFKDEYTKTLDIAKRNLKNYEDKLEKALAEKKDLAENIGTKKAKDIEKELNKALEKGGPKEAMAFINKLNGNDKKFAEACMKAIELENQKNRAMDMSADFMSHKLQNAVESGVIDDTTFRRLFEDYQKSLQGEESKSSEIIDSSIHRVSNKIETEEVRKTNRVDSEEVVETNTVTSEENVKETEVIDLTDDLKLPKATLNSTIRSTRRPTINNSKILDILEGDITVDGDFTDSNLVDFNVKILEKAKHGAYNEDNFREAERKVQEEGDLAVKRLEKFKDNQTAANARNLTQAGRKYAQLMVESAQAGMFIVAAGMTERQDVKENENTVDIKVNRGATMQTLENNKMLNIVDDLNNRKKMA